MASSSQLSFIKIPVTILQRVTPVCFEAVLDPFEPLAQDANYTYALLDKEINDYYNNYDIFTEKAYSPKHGEIIIVCHPTDQRWYRAKMITTIETTKGYQASVHLMDMNRKLNVPFRSVRKIYEAFSMYAPQGVTLELPGITPCTLQYDPDRMKSEPRASKTWDTHAYTFVDETLKRKEQTFFTVLEVVSPDKFLGKMYFQLKGQLHCLNDLLVEKQYALLQDDDSDVLDKDLDDVPLGGSATTYLKSQSPVTLESGTSLQQRPHSRLEEWEMLQEELRKKARDSGCDIMNPEENQKFPVAQLPQSNCNRGFVIDPDRAVCDPSKNAQSLVLPESVLSPEAKDGRRDVRALFPEEGRCPRCHFPPSTPVVARPDNRAKRYSLPRVPSPKSSAGSPLSPSGCKERSDISSDVSNISSIQGRTMSDPKLNLKDKMLSPIYKDEEHIVEMSQSVTRSSSRASSHRSQRLSPCELLKKFKLSCPQSGLVSSACTGQNESALSCRSSSDRLPNPVSTNGVNGETALPSCPPKEMLNKLGCNGGNTVVSAASDYHLNRLYDALKIVPPSVIAGNSKESDSSAAKDLIQLRVESPTFKLNSPNSDVPLPVGRGKTLKETQYRMHHQNRSDKPCVQVPESSKNAGPSTEDAKKDSIERDAVRQSSTHRFYVTPPTNPNFSTSMDDPLGVDSTTFRKILVCGQKSPKPVREITKASFNSFIMGRLKSCNFEYPATIQSYAWPAVMRGRNVAVVSGPRSGKTCCYLLPLLSSILDGVMYSNVPAGNEPVAVVICPFWRSATKVYDMCMRFLHGCQTVHPLLIHGGGYDENQRIQLINGCDILFATPCAILRILRGDGTKPTSLNRLCHLILDEADILAEEFTEELREILEEYTSVLKLRKVHNFPCQIMTFGCKWTPGLKSFISCVMPNPLFYCSSFCESIIFAGIKTVAHTFSPEERSDKLIDLLRPNLNTNDKKIVICTSDVKSAQVLHHSLSYASKFKNVNLATEDLTASEVIRVGESWRASQLQGQQPILIVTDRCLEELNIDDAECLIHYDIPAWYKSSFGLRFSCLLRHMQRDSISETSTDSVVPCVSHIITTSDCVLQAHGLIQLLKRLSSEIPTPLLSLALGYYQGGEERKEPVPFCNNMKAFGQCSNQYWCKERHILLPVNDAPSSSIVREGLVRLHITNVRNATWFHGRIIEYQTADGTWEHVQPTFLTLNYDMNMHFVKGSNRFPHFHPKVGDMCAIVGKDDSYYRVRVLEKPSIKSSTKIRVVSVLLVDLGRISVVEVPDLLQLPASLAACPAQAVEVFFCNLRPVDKDHAWTNKACAVVDDMLCGQDVTGKVALCLGRIVWLSSLVKQTKLGRTSQYITEFDLGETLITEQFAIENPKHLQTLECLAQEVFPLPPPMEISRIVGSDAAAPKTPSNVEFAFLPLKKYEAVNISCLRNPGRFFVRKVASFLCLENLMNELEDYKKERPKSVQAVTLGMFCVAVFPSDECFYRGRVIEILPNTVDPSMGDDVRIFYLDYGDEHVVKAKFVYPLQHKHVWKLPFQAIECRLAGVAPMLDSGWTEETSNFMWDNAHNLGNAHNLEKSKKKLWIKALRKCCSSADDGICYEVELYDTTTDEEINFSDWLCSTSHARSVDSMEQQNGAENENSEGSPVQSEGAENGELTNGVEDHNGICESGNGRHSSRHLEQTRHSLAIKPRVLWSDTAAHIELQIMIAGVKQHFLVVKTNHLLYNTLVDNAFYELDIDLFGEIDENVSGEIHETYVKVKLNKKKSEKWPRLLKEKVKEFWLSVDYDKLMESSDDERSVPSRVDWQELRGPKKVTTSVRNYRPDIANASESDSDDNDSVVSKDSLISEPADPFTLF